MDLIVLQNIWFFLVGILFVGYSLLDGFDLGIGMLFKFIAKRDAEKRVLFNAIGPFWDGNEVWLITGGGALFAAFPHAYATVFSGFYLALFLVLFGLIFRAVSLEFWVHDFARRRLWEWAFVLGSLIPSLLFGVALGNVIQGVPLNANMDYQGDFFLLLRPFPLSMGILGLVGFMLHGSTYVSWRTTGLLKERAERWAKFLWYAFGIMVLVTFLAAFIYIPDFTSMGTGNVVTWLATLVLVAAFVILRKVMGMKKEFLSFVMTAALFIALWGIVGAMHYPNLVRASNDSNLSITLMNGSSQVNTLTVMLIVTLIFFPVVLIYKFFVYRIFKGKVQLPEES